MKYYWFAHGEVAGVRGTISRTGYTGEDGFEVFVPPAQAAACGTRCCDAGERRWRRFPPASARATPCASRRRCGSSATTSTRPTTVLEADLGWIVGWKKDDFIGATRLRAQKAAGVTRQLVGFEMVDRAIARHGYPVVSTAPVGRRRHQRHADAVPEEGDRHGLRAARWPRPSAEIRRSTSAAGRRAPGRPPAVLQAAQELTPRDVSGRPEVHEGPRVDPHRAATRPTSASPTMRSSSSATWCSSSCREVGRGRRREKCSARSSR